MFLKVTSYQQPLSTTLCVHYYEYYVNWNLIAVVRSLTCIWLHSYQPCTHAGRAWVQGYIAISRVSIHYIGTPIT